MELERRIQRNGEIRLRPDGRLEGYAIVWDARSVDLGGFVETVAKDAVRLDEDVLATFNHEVGALLGKRSAGTLEVESDAHGLAFRVKLPDTSAGRDVRELVRRGDVSGASFTFWVLEDGQRWTQEAGGDLRVLTSILVSELGPVALPAYPDTAVAVRARGLARTNAPKPGPPAIHNPGALRRQRILETLAGR